MVTHSLLRHQTYGQPEGDEAASAVEPMYAMHERVLAAVESAGHGLDHVAQLVVPIVFLDVYVPLLPFAATATVAAQEVDHQLDVVVVHPLVHPPECSTRPQPRAILQLSDQRWRRAHGTAGT